MDTYVIHCQGWMGYVVPFFIKTAYSNEPTFANTKVVTSVYDEVLENSINENFKKCVEFKDITRESLTAYSDAFNFDEFGKLAVDYSDAVIEAVPNANSKLIGYAKEKGVPVLDFVEGDKVESYKEFYEKYL